MARRLVVVAALAIAALLTAGCAPPPPAPDPPPAVTGPSPGCGSTTRGPVTDRSETIKVGDQTRMYSITVPPQHRPGTKRPIPLVLDFHGFLEGVVGTHPVATQLSAKAAAEGFAVVFPTGSVGGLLWDISQSESNPDLHFVDAIISELGSTMCIDRSRVYVTGLSYGAFMTSMLMCMRPNTFAAAAPVAGIQNACGPTERSVPFVTFHGTGDWMLPFALFADTPGQIAEKYGCAKPVSTTLQPAPDPATGGDIVHTTWDCRKAHTAAESYVIGGGGHTWPGSTFFTLVGFLVGATPTSLDATDVMWDFFSRHHL